MTNTTLAIHKSDAEDAEIITLGGQYPGCREGVRLVASHRGSLPHLSLVTIVETLGRRSDVAIWGSGTTWTVTEAEVAALTEISRRNVEAAEARQRAEDAEITAEPRSTRPCPHCGTYCYGDCQAV